MLHAISLCMREADRGSPRAFVWFMTLIYVINSMHISYFTTKKYEDGVHPPLEDNNNIYIYILYIYTHTYIFILAISHFLHLFCVPQLLGCCLAHFFRTIHFSRHNSIMMFFFPDALHSPISRQSPSPISNLSYCRKEETGTDSISSDQRCQ
jgi:hypothetical protein